MDTYEKKCFEKYTCPGLLKVQESIFQISTEMYKFPLIILKKKDACP